MTSYSYRSGLAAGFLFVSITTLAQFTSSNLPIFVINTAGVQIPDEPKIGATMGIIDNGPGVRNYMTDPFNEYNGKIGIETRGSSSQMFPKKQYGFELRDDNGNEAEASLLGLPEESDWILSAPYNDKSLLRDVLAYKLGRDLGHYAPRTRYCEVVLNGNYQGIYFLNEKIKRDKNRVNINKLDPDEISGNNLTGGYIIKIDKSDGDSGPGWNSSYVPHGRKSGQVITFQYESPKWDEIVPEQKKYIQDYVNAFESALAGDDFRDPSAGYAKYIDIPSFIDFFIANEVTKNVDGYRISTFLHKQRGSDGGKLVMGPIWDFNLGFGNVDYCLGGSTDGFVLHFNNVCPDDFWLIPFWWTRLMEDKNFALAVSERWQVLRSDLFKTERILSYIDSVTNVLNQEAQQRNFQKWPVLGTYVWPNYYVGPTFQSEVAWLEQWTGDRLAWLDQNIPQLITSTREDHGNEARMESVFPNPFVSEIDFEFRIGQPGLLEVELYNSEGKHLEQNNEFHSLNGVYRKTLGKSVPAGLYFYRTLFQGKLLSAGKIVKR